MDRLRRRWKEHLWRNFRKHFMKMGDGRKYVRIMVHKCTGKRPLRRLRSRWEYNFNRKLTEICSGSGR
jgi:hypothetical protein